MRRFALALVILLLLAGCGGSGGKPRTNVGEQRPENFAPAEIDAARAANADLFAIFPRRRGTRRCAIPAGRMAGDVLHGTCRTSVAYPTTHGRYLEAFVTFREDWDNHHSSWTLIVQWPAEKVVATELHGEVSPQMRYAVTDHVASPRLSVDLRLTRNVPCPGNAPRVGPEELSRVHAVTAVMCTDGGRIFPGQGQWEVFVRKVAVGGVAGSQRYFEQRSQPNLPKNGICLDYLAVVVPIAFVNAQGSWLVPKTPVDGCNHPLGLPKGQKPTHVRWHVVSVHRIRQLVSAPALAARCDMKWKNETAGQAGPLRQTSGGAVFAEAPKTVRVCAYRMPPGSTEVGNFVRGFSLDSAKTRRLLAGLTGAGPRGSCSEQRTFAVIIANPGLESNVELGGCFRVVRPYPNHGLGSANPAVVRAILGVGQE